MNCDVGEATEGLENELRRKGWRMSCDVGEVLCSFFNLLVASSTSQLILQHFRCFTYVTAHSPILPLLHLCHRSFSNPSFSSPTSQALHLIHLASRTWTQLKYTCSIKYRYSTNQKIPMHQWKAYILIILVCAIERQLP